MAQNTSSYTSEIPIELKKEMDRIKSEYGFAIYWQILEGIRLFVEQHPPKK